MKAIVHCGGFGTRLKSLTRDTPKPMIELNGKPLLYWIIENLKKFDVTDICITLHYQPDKIKDYFKDGSDMNIKISYYLEKEPMGTGGSLIKMKDFIDHEDVIIAYGDVFSNINLEKLIKFHKNNKSMITAVIHKSTHPEDSDLVIIDNKMKLLEILKKPHKIIPNKPQNLAALYVINYKILEYLNKKGKFDIAHDLLPRLIKLNKSIFCYNTEELIMDVGTPERFEAAQKVINK